MLLEDGELATLQRAAAFLGGHYDTAPELAGALGACGDPQARGWFESELLREKRKDLKSWAKHWLKWESEDIGGSD